MRAAAAAIEQLLAGRALPASLDQAAADHRLTGVSRAAARDMAYGTARNLGTVQALAARLNARPAGPGIGALQLVGLSELLEPQRRHQAVIVDQLVSAARDEAALAPAAAFLNATMRRFLRERDALIADIANEPQARWNHPEWWIDQLRQDHPRHWEAVLQAGQRRPPMTLRVNTRRGTTGQYLQRLLDTGRGARQIGPAALILDEPCDVGEMPGFLQGDVSVQDLAAQLAAPLLGARDGERVLDACAAPGGKTAHLLELSDCRVTALDSDAARLQRVRDTLSRIGRTAEVRHGDAARPADWWDGKPFDRILLDAPCSASGIVRRHPDVRWLRRRSDIATMARRQSEMLTALWGVLRPGGTLLFATCSVFRAEGEQVVERFCGRQADAQRQPVIWRWHGESQDHRISHLLPQSVPHRDHDGFFYASILKRP
ncbi:MAG TPA: 16S rRNA (cytosine(967)-C(5))-methyltransferase RsmB [Burkholderiaceae bacterium]|nr:16S rRNA (cytosine(967)-C(5))-methyltransferase RsmB [Burkholderiaceae bacterium]